MCVTAELDWVFSIVEVRCCWGPLVAYHCIEKELLSELLIIVCSVSRRKVVKYSSQNKVAAVAAAAGSSRRIVKSNSRRKVVNCSSVVELLCGVSDWGTRFLPPPTPPAIQSTPKEIFTIQFSQEETLPQFSSLLVLCENPF